MGSRLTELLEQTVAWLAALLVVVVTVRVIAGYRAYLPPDFSSDFLRGREAYFFGSYRWAFYAHIVTGPVALLLGLALVAERVRGRFPRFHRRLGWAQVACVLLVVAPSGLFMARHAAAGPVAGAGLAVLALATAACAGLGLRAAVRGRFEIHRRWMGRCYALLCSAVVLRVLSGLATILGVTAAWFDPVASWVSWLLPLAGFELVSTRRSRGPRRRQS